ncbi:ABC transporter permease [Oleiharenicola lentus]|uniref:Transport permease protein n=1 Tax=Oleiharenicola lentus TaxID=2508720 RepID=A0A4Q1C9Q3_9BACT|nr:ABC transporter permease [Oleiharenicola lentus]RXK55735.1 ABC transporter permease [Oleiharenicola lentus]
MPPRPNAILVTLWRNRSLVGQFTKRQVELRHKGSHLGLVWSLLNPLLMLALYVVVFGYIFGGRFKPEELPETRVEYALVVFLGLAIHHFLAEVMATSPSLVTSNPNFVKKVVFPLEILPAANLGAASVHFLITLGLVLGGALVCGVPLQAGVLWLPVLILPLALMALGLSLGLSALGVFWRDVAQITQFLSLALLFASAVFYPVAKIPPEIYTILRFNPLLLTIQEARSVVFWDHPLNFTHLAYLGGCGLISYLLGAWIYQRLRPSFADVL